jgi:exopolyphosphatase / guanosine-5'-triphosphate,3'-diphosphate pyrophosphatase
MTPVAAIDCGTNSIRLLIAEPAPSEAGGPPKLVDLDRRLEVVRLGQGVDATREFHPEALARTFAAVDSYAEAIKAAGVGPERTQFVATSATRDARNREEFFEGIRQRLGVTPEVISGDTEARLSFLGALNGIQPTSEPVLVMDIGGGSTELIIGSRAGNVAGAVSLDIGSVRATERFWGAGNRPTSEDLTWAADYIDSLLDGSGIDLGSVQFFIGVAGTVTTLAAIDLDLQSYDRERVHGHAMNDEVLKSLLEELSGKTPDEIRQIPGVHPGRAEVITGGALIAQRVAARVVAPEMAVSESDILDGIALQMLAA